MATMYTNYQVTPAPSQRSADSGSAPDFLDDSIYSTTPFGAPSVFSPKGSATSASKKNVHFDFPPELHPSSSSESSSSLSDRENMTRFPAYTQPMSSSTNSSLTATPRSSTSNTLTVRSPNSIRVPRSNNPFGADAVHPKKKTMKKQRKRRTAAGTVGGAVVGGLVLGPVGVFVGGAAGGVAANKIHKARERRAQRKYEQRNFQNAALRSNVHVGAFA